MSTYQRNEAGNAELFATLYADTNRYDHKRQAWYQFQTNHGRRWIQDDTNYIRHYAALAAETRKARAVTISDEKEKGREIKYASDSKNVRNIDNTLKLASSLPEIVFSSTWDSDPWLFQVENGVIDLRNGKLREAQIGDYLLTRSSVFYEETAKCPKWEGFINSVFEGKLDLVKFIRQAVGYSLTGLTREQVLFCLYGSGGNGKGVFIRILSALFGEYGTPVNKEILFQAANRIVGDGANLPGKRFVTASEVSGRGELDSDRIKAWTGSDEMIARELYKPAFSFQPQFKLWLSFNSRPAIYDQSEGMWRRLRMIPFDRKFEGADRNFNLYEELHAELPGILNWAIQGCLEYQESKRGLEVPASVETVNRAYRDDFNPFVNFLTDQCIVQSSFSCNASEFHARYVKWCKEQNEKPLGKPRVAEQLKALGIYKERPKTGVTRQWQFYGLELVPEYSAFSGERLPVAV